jgi:hypothetical protein
MTRYLSTNAATPNVLSQRATSCASRSMARMPQAAAGADNHGRARRRGGIGQIDGEGPPCHVADTADRILWGDLLRFRLPPALRSGRRPGPDRDHFRFSRQRGGGDKWGKRKFGHSRPTPSCLRGSRLSRVQAPDLRCGTRCQGIEGGDSVETRRRARPSRGEYWVRRLPIKFLAPCVSQLPEDREPR